jgi:hypothetical protein
VTGTRKLRRTFTIEPDLLEKLRAIKARTGLSESEQVRQGIRWWLESREWPVRKTTEDAERKPAPDAEPAAAKPAAAPARVRKRR